MDNQMYNENYWKSSLTKPFSFDDDDENDGGFGVGAAIGGSAKSETGGILNDDAVSEASFDNSSAGEALNLSIKAVISEEALKIILQEQSLDDRVISKGVTQEEELKMLRRQIQTTLYSPSPEATAYKLLLGKTVPLEVFKSLHEKEELLDAVLKNGGGDAVIVVVLFLKQSLNHTIFHKVLQQRPKALEHYISYLKQSKSHDTIKLLQLFGKHQDAALLQFQDALECNEPPQRKQRLRQLIESYVSGSKLGVITLYQQLFHATLKLLELVEKERSSLDNLVDLNSTPIEVLYACCRKHKNWKDQDLVHATSPFRLCAEQQISAAQFEWTALNERTQAQAFADLETVFERVPTWHPMKQKQFHISFSLAAAVLRLHELQAPPTVLYLFLSKMSNNTEKLELAQSVKCTKAVIDALAGLKEVGQLTQLRDSLTERSEEQFYCEKALRGLQSKRWSTDNMKLKL